MDLPRLLVSATVNFHMAELDQILRCTGELRIVTPSGTESRVQGRINFTDDNETSIGEMKVFGGTLANYRLILDSSSITNGISFRTAPSSGTVTEGGEGFPYIVNIGGASSGAEINGRLRVNPFFTLNGDTDSTLATFQKTRDSYTTFKMESRMAEYIMTNFVQGQSIEVQIGTSALTRRMVLGYRGGYSPTSANYGYLGMVGSLGLKENIQLTNDGSVNIPVKLTVDTIDAVNYLNLPITPLPSLLPITLDTVNNRVGINNTTPAVELDVTGDVGVSGSINQLLISSPGSTSNINIRPESGGDNSVAIGWNAGQVDQALQAVAIGLSAGSTTQSANSIAVGTQAGMTTQGASSIAIGVNAGKTSQGAGAIAIGANAADTNQHANSIVISASGARTNTTAANTFYVKPIRDAVGPQTLAYDPTSGEITYTPTLSLLPITLDAPNNRVGINNTVPTQALDVTGTIAASTAITTPLLNNLRVISPGDGNLAVGISAGENNQGANAVAIGAFAGFTNQHANSIVLNATGSDLNTTAASQLIVKPVRDLAGPKTLTYNPTSGEVSYTTASSGPTVFQSSGTGYFPNTGLYPVVTPTVTVSTPGIYNIYVRVVGTVVTAFNQTSGTHSPNFGGWVLTRPEVYYKWLGLVNATVNSLGIRNNLVGDQLDFGIAQMYGFPVESSTTFAVPFNMPANNAPTNGIRCDFTITAVKQN